MLIIPAGLAKSGRGVCVRVVQERDDPPETLQLASEALHTSLGVKQVVSGHERFRKRPAVEAVVNQAACTGAEAMLTAGDAIAKLLRQRGLTPETTRIERLRLRIQVKS